MVSSLRSRCRHRAQASIERVAQLVARLTDFDLWNSLRAIKSGWKADRICRFEVVGSGAIHGSLALEDELAHASAGSKFIVYTYAE
jgi:hypothetical protein